MEWHPRTIVVGVDGSDESHRAAQHAVSMAAHWKAKLLLTTVVRTPEGWWGIGGAPPTPEALSEAIVQGQEKVLEEERRLLNLDEVDHETVQELGDPVGRLLAVAEANNADVIVIGRRGAGLAERVVMGSVADRITHLATCPVLIVP